MTTQIDLAYVSKETRKYWKTNPKEISDFEERFLTTTLDLVDSGVSISQKQLYWLYRIYYKHIEGDMDMFEEWVNHNGMRAIHQEYEKPH